ncbi:hypothetical protein ACEPPN_019379 [Leptodophora sp. 'Broadleaf-Isolate-01']
MALLTSETPSRDGRITDRTRSMFRAILAENCIADTDDAILDEEMVMFFKLTRSHRIKLGRPGDFAGCPVVIDDDDDDNLRGTATHAVDPVPHRSSPPSISPSSSASSPLSSLRSSPASSPPPPIVPSPHMLLRGTSGNGPSREGIYVGMDGPNKKKRRYTSCEEPHKATDSSQPERSLAKSVEVGDTDVAAGEALDGQVHNSNPEPLGIGTEGSIGLEGDLPVASSPGYASKEADPKCQVPPLEGGMLDILLPEDAVDVMTGVLLTATKVRIQAGKFGSQDVTLGTTTDINKIREYTEEWLVKQPFEVATVKIAKAGAGYAGIGLQKSWEEVFYWEIIQRYAATLNSMPTARGPHDGFTPQEKVATSQFINMVGAGTSDENQRKCRLWWRDLSDMQNAGVLYTLLYRDTKFNQYCKKFPRGKHSSQQLIDTIVSWEKVYSSHIKQVELRALNWTRGDYSGRTDLQHSSVAEILSIPDSSWDNGSNMWYSEREETSWKLTGSCTATSMESNMNRLLRDAYVGSGTNKSFFVSLRPGIHTLVSVFPVVPVAAGDLLGIFAGKVRFSEHCNAARSILGPAPQLWLDYSQATGTLNQMQVSLLTEEANVHLTWEGVNEALESGPCDSWRVLVLASRNIVPFEPLVRAATSMEQFAIHRSSDDARRGFLVEPS